MAAIVRVPPARLKRLLYDHGHLDLSRARLDAIADDPNATGSIVGISPDFSLWHLLDSVPCSASPTRSAGRDLVELRPVGNELSLALRAVGVDAECVPHGLPPELAGTDSISSRWTRFTSGR